MQLAFCLCFEIGVRLSRLCLGHIVGRENSPHKRQQQRALRAEGMQVRPTFRRCDECYRRVPSRLRIHSINLLPQMFQRTFGQIIARYPADLLCIRYQIADLLY